MLSDSIQEARRQLNVCNACRYCEGYCSVFPAVHSRRALDDVTVTHLANLCHNCRGCYYACQYTDPHEFAINLPAALADVRQQSWQDYTWPVSFSRIFHHSGLAIVLATIVGFAVLLLTVHYLGSRQGEGFYGVLSHNAMLSIFLPAFLLPIVVIVVSVRQYWKASNAGDTGRAAIVDTVSAAATMNNLAGGHGEGCNFEDEDRFSNARRWFHQATLYGFLLCFASTSVATLMHYFFNMPAPYPLFSLPKLFGLSGGLLLCTGTAGLAYLKMKADAKLGATSAWGGEMGFVVLLFLVSASGLVLYWFGDSAFLQALLVFHLGAVFAFFLLMPYTKMMHGFFRLAALLKDKNERRNKAL